VLSVWVAIDPWSRCPPLRRRAIPDAWRAGRHARSCSSHADGRSGPTSPRLLPEKWRPRRSAHRHERASSGPRPQPPVAAEARGTPGWGDACPPARRTRRPAAGFDSLAATVQELTGLWPTPWVSLLDHPWECLGLQRLARPLGVRAALPLQPSDTHVELGVPAKPAPKTSGSTA